MHRFDIDATMPHRMVEFELAAMAQATPMPMPMITENRVIWIVVSAPDRKSRQ